MPGRRRTDRALIRKLFFTLVLANLAVAAWMAWFADPRPGESAPRRSGVPIRLVSEAEPGALLVAERAPAPANDVPTTEMPGAVVVADAPGESVDVERPSAADEAVALAPSIAATGVSEPAAAAEIACITVGPFADSGGAEAAAAALEAAAYAASQRRA